MFLDRTIDGDILHLELHLNVDLILEQEGKLLRGHMVNVL